MIREIHQLTLKQMQTRVARGDHANEVVISMLDHEEVQRHGRPDLSKFRASLALEFFDAYEEEWEAWPDEPSEQEHLVLAPGAGERIPSLGDARKIVEFAEAFRLSADPVILITHCMAGKSRSVAVADWIASHCCAPITRDTVEACLVDGFVLSRRPNPRLMRLMDTARRELGLR